MNILCINALGMKVVSFQVLFCCIPFWFKWCQSIINLSSV